MCEPFYIGFINFMLEGKSLKFQKKCIKKYKKNAILLFKV